MSGQFLVISKPHENPLAIYLHRLGNFTLGPQQGTLRSFKILSRTFSRLLPLSGSTSCLRTQCPFSLSRCVVGPCEVRLKALTVNKVFPKYYLPFGICAPIKQTTIRCKMWPSYHSCHSCHNFCPPYITPLFTHLTTLLAVSYQFWSTLHHFPALPTFHRQDHTHSGTVHNRSAMMKYIQIRMNIKCKWNYQKCYIFHFHYKI